MVGQQHVLHPSRVPDAAAALWIELQEFPFTPLGDAAGTIDTGRGWDSRLAHEFAERILERIAAHAPGLPDLVVGIDAITPVDLAARNVNAFAGDPYGGSAELDQNFLWRPLSSSPGHDTPIPKLWHIGASTHPGPGLGGTSGNLVADRLLTPPGGQRLHDVALGAVNRSRKHYRQNNRRADK